MTVEILSATAKPGKKGEYLSIKYRVNGDTKFINAFGALAKKYSGPGTYEIETEPNGEYENLTSLTFVSAAKTTTTPNGTQVLPVDPNSIIKDKSIIAQVAFKGAVAIAAAQIQKGQVGAEDGVLTMTEVFTKGLINLVKTGTVKAKEPLGA